MRRLLLITVLALSSIAVVLPATASADQVACLNDAGCELAGGAPVASLTAAYTYADAHTGTTTLHIGASTTPYAVTGTYSVNNPIVVVGAGVGQTIIAAGAPKAMELDNAASSVRDLTVRFVSAVNATGIELRGGTATRVAVDGMPGNNAIAFQLYGDAVLDHATVEFPTNTTAGTAAHVQPDALSAGHTTVIRDSSFTAPTGIYATYGTDANARGGLFRVERSTIRYNTIGVEVFNGFGKTPLGGSVSSSRLERAADGNVSNTNAVEADSSGQASTGTAGVNVYDSTLVAPNLNSIQGAIVASGGSKAGVTVDLRNSILTGFAQAFIALDNDGTTNTYATINAEYDVLPPASADFTNVVTNGHASISRTNTVAGDPLFVDAAHGDYHLRAGSPAIDAGEPLAAYPLESTTDLDGASRFAAGSGTSAGARRDLGAWEYQYTAPTVVADAAPLAVTAGTPVGFSASAADIDDGETAALAYAWTFSDGSTASTATVSRVPAAAGEYRGTVVVTDPAGRTASAIVTVQVAAAPVTPVVPVVPPVVKDVTPPVVKLVVAALKRAALVQKAGPKLSTTVTVGEASKVTTTFTLVATHRKLKTRKLVLASSVVTAKAAGRLAVKASTTAKVRRKITPFLAARKGDTYTLLVHVTARDAAGNTGSRDASVRVR